MEEIKLLIGGDLVITDEEYTAADIDSDVVSVFQSSDLSILNLECPITKAGESDRILKTGPHLKGVDKPTVEIFKALNIRLVTLANNHILDYGQKGLQDTLTFCNDNNIGVVGGGMNLEEAKRPWRGIIRGVKLSIINFAENEWASATSSSAGASPMDIIDNVKQIQEEKALSDTVIVIVHGGHEYYNFPSPRMRKQYRFYADSGADLIIGHHTHCISGSEVYNGVPIFYSLGNFLFTKRSRQEDWYTGLVLELKIKKSSPINVVLHPIRQAKESHELYFLKDDEKEKIFERVMYYDSVIVNDEKLLQEWKEYVNRKSKSYLNFWSPLAYLGNGFLKRVLSKFDINGINREGGRLALNLMRCEAHADMSKEVLKKYLANENEDRHTP